MPRQRWTAILLCFFACTINYVDRANLAVAVPFLRKEFGLDAATMGLVLSGFFWTYAVMQMPWGWIADRAGPRVSLAVAVIWWSLFTALTAMAHGLGSLLGYRLLLGVGEAGAYPSFPKVVASWFPRRERSFATSIFDSGSRVGAVISLPFVTLIIAYLGWRASFAPIAVRTWSSRQARSRRVPLVITVSLPDDLGHDDRLLLFKLRDLLLHHLVPDLFGAGARVLARGTRHAGRAARCSVDSRRLARRLRLRLALPPRLEPDCGAQDLLGGWHVDVVRDHPLGLRIKHL